jgi:GAF domain-containing protein/HAMP domain-containing protein
MTVENMKPSHITAENPRNIARILTVTLLSGPLGAIAFVILAWQTNTWQFGILALASGISALFAGLGNYWLRQGKNEAAGWLTLVLGLLTLIVGPFLFQDLGTLFGLSAIILGILISGMALHGQHAVRGSFLSIGVGIIGILLDLFNYPNRLQLPSYLPIFLSMSLGLIILILSINFFRQINNYSIRVKQIFSLVSIAIISTGAVSFAISRTTQTQIQTQMYEGVNSQASSLGLVLGNEIAKEVELLNTLSLNGVIIQAVETANQSYPLNDGQIRTKITTAEQNWQAAIALNNLSDPLVQSVTNNQAVGQLKLFRLISTDHLQLLITDRYGALVASTSKTAAYNQSRQVWWQAAFLSGRGATYLSNPQFDETTRKYTLTLIIPIRDQGGELIGFIHSDYRIAGLLQRLASVRIGTTSNASLLFADGKIIDAGGTVSQLDPNTLTQLEKSQKGFAQFRFSGKDRIVSQAALDSNSNLKNFIRALKWQAVIDEDPIKISLPLQAITRTSLLIGLGSLLVASALAFLAGQFLSGPITRLTKVAEAVRAGDLNARATVESQDEIGILADTFNSTTAQLQTTLKNLEERVAERTTALEQRSRELADRTVALELANVRTQKRAAQLQAIAEVARTIAGVRKLADILPGITKVVSEQFGFYHTGIFLLDEAHEYALLGAANSEGGQRMLARGHRLKVGAQGIVGYVTDTGSPRIALDTRNDAIFLKNPDLPETHSEMAVPLKSGEKIIGALDVQSNQSNAFSQEDLEVLQVLADQISIAIENSRQFDQTQKSLNEAETIFKQYLHREWDRLRDSEKVLGYRYSVTGVEPIENPIAPDPLQIDKKTEAKEAVITIPIKVRNEVIGILNIRNPGKRTWTKEEIGLVEAVAERVAVSAENARLFDESQKRAAKEQIIGEITSKIGASINLSNIMQTAVEELGHTLSGSQVSIRLKK